MHAYVEPARDGGAERTPLPDSEHTQQLQMVRSNQRDNDRLRIIRNLTFSYSFTAAQAAAFVAEFEFTEAKHEACVLLHAALSDADNFDAVLAKLRFDAERDAVRQKVGLAAPAAAPAAPQAKPAAAPRPAAQPKDEVSWMKKKPADSDEDSD